MSLNRASAAATPNQSYLFQLPKQLKILYKFNHLFNIWDLKMSPTVRDFYRLPENMPQLIAVLRNDREFALMNLPREEDFIWMEVAIFADASEIYKLLFERNIAEAKSKFSALTSEIRTTFANMAISADNLSAFKYLYDQALLISTNIVTWLAVAAENSSLSIFQFLFERSTPNTTTNKITPELVEKLLHSGFALDKLLSTESPYTSYMRKELLDDPAINDHLIGYIQDNKLESFKIAATWLSKHADGFRYQGYLVAAYRYGRLSIVEFIRNSAPNSDFLPQDNRQLKTFIARSGNLPLLIRFLDTQKNNVVVDNEIFECAARSGNAQMLKYLLATFPQLKMTIQSLTNALLAETPDALEYLLALNDQSALIPAREIRNACASNHKIKIPRYLL